MVVTQPAGGAVVPAFFGYATGLQFSCGRGGEATQPAVGHMDAGGAASLAAGWRAPANPERAYGVDAELLAGLPVGHSVIESGKWVISIDHRPIFIVVDPNRTNLAGEVGFGSGRWLAMRGRGTMEHYDTRSTTNPVESCFVEWFFAGQRRDRPPTKPRGKKWLQNRFIQLQAASQGKSLGADVAAAAVPQSWVGISPCAKETTCFGPPGANRADLLVRVLPVSGGNQAPAFVSLATAAIDVWSRRAGAGDASVHGWQIPAAASALDHPGVLDVIGYGSPSSADVLDEQGAMTGDSSTDVRDEMTIAALDDDSPPPAGSWLTVPTLPGFGFQAVLGGATLVSASTCPVQTVCFARTAGDAPEIVARILPTQANGKRWAVLGKFASEAADVWVQQTASQHVEHYQLIARAPDSPELPGIVDRASFAP